MDGPVKIPCGSTMADEGNFHICTKRQFHWKRSLYVDVRSYEKSSFTVPQDEYEPSIHPNIMANFIW